MAPRGGVDDALHARHAVRVGALTLAVVAALWGLGCVAGPAAGTAAGDPAADDPAVDDPAADDTAADDTAADDTAARDPCEDRDEHDGEDPAELVGDPGCGADTYDSHCSSCHGEDGRGGQGYPDLAARVPELRDDELVATIERGPGGMPAFAGTPQMIADVVAWLRQEFGGPPG